MKNASQSNSTLELMTQEKIKEKEIHFSKHIQWKLRSSKSAGFCSSELDSNCKLNLNISSSNSSQQEKKEEQNTKWKTNNLEEQNKETRKSSSTQLRKQKNKRHLVSVKVYELLLLQVKSLKHRSKRRESIFLPLWSLFSGLMILYLAPELSLSTSFCRRSFWKEWAEKGIVAVIDEATKSWGHEDSRQEKLLSPRHVEATIVSGERPTVVPQRLLSWLLVDSDGGSFDEIEWHLQMQINVKQYIKAGFVNTITKIDDTC